MHNMRKISDAQKAAQKRYDQKTHMISIKYTPKDEDEYYMLQNYLSHSGESANKFIKNLVFDYLSQNDWDVDKNSAFNGNKITTDENMIDPFIGLKKENIQYLYDHFNRSGVNRLLEEYRQRTVQLIQKEYAAKFNEWVEKRVKILAENNPKLSRNGKTLELYRLFNIRFPIT